MEAVRLRPALVDSSKDQDPQVSSSAEISPEISSSDDKEGATISSVVLHPEVSDSEMAYVNN